MCKTWASSFCRVDSCHGFCIQSELCVAIMWAVGIMDQKHPPPSPYTIHHSSWWEEFRTDEPSFQFLCVVKGKRNKTGRMRSYCNLAVYAARIHYWFAQIHHSPVPNIHYSKITFIYALGPPCNVLISYNHRQLWRKSMRSGYSRHHWPTLLLHSTFLPKITYIS